MKGQKEVFGPTQFELIQISNHLQLLLDATTNKAILNKIYFCFDRINDNLIQIMQRIAKSKAALNTKTNKIKQQDEETINDLKEAFKIFDSKNTGQIDARELKAIMKAFGMEVKKQDVRDIYAELGKEIKEGLGFNQFLGVMTSRIGSRDSKEEILKIFKLFDEDNLNKITFKNLKRIASEIGEKIPDEELKEMLEQADRDGDGMLNFEQFYRIMRRRGDPLDDFDSDDE